MSDVQAERVVGSPYRSRSGVVYERHVRPDGAWWTSDRGKTVVRAIREALPGGRHEFIKPQPETVAEAVSDVEPRFPAVVGRGKRSRADRLPRFNDPVRFPDGELGLMFVSDRAGPYAIGRDHCVRLEDLPASWREAFEDAYPFLIDGKELWPLPGPPAEYSLTGTTLRDEIVANVRAYVDYPGMEELYGADADWVTASWVRESVRFAPIATYTGPTQIGKTVAFRVLSRLAYRGWLADPTPAMTYRTNEKYRTTVFVDEFAGIQEDVKSDLVRLFKMGVERGQLVGRAAAKTNEPQFFDPFGHKGLATKEPGLPEDFENRAILHPMRPRVRDLKDAYAADLDDTALVLRSRLLRFRYDVIVGSLVLRRDEAARRAAAHVPIFNDRTRSMVVGLLEAGLVFGRADDTLIAMGRSQMSADETLLETREAIIVRAVAELLRDGHGDMYTADVARHIASAILLDAPRDRRYKGDAERSDSPYVVGYSPEVVGRLIRRPLNLSTKRRTGGTVIDTASPTFQAVFPGLCTKYQVEPAAPPVKQVVLEPA